MVGEEEVGRVVEGLRVHALGLLALRVGRSLESNSGQICVPCYLGAARVR